MSHGIALSPRVAESPVARHRRVSSLTSPPHKPSQKSQASFAQSGFRNLHHSSSCGARQMADTASSLDLRELESQSSVTLSQVDDGDSSSTTTSSSTVSCQSAFGVFARRRRRASSRRETPIASPRAVADHFRDGTAAAVIGGFPATRKAAPMAPAPELPRLLHHEMRRDIRRSDGEESGDEGDGGGGGSKSSRGSAAVTILKDAAQTVARKVRGADAAAWGQLGALQGGALPRPLASAARRQKPPLALKPRRFNERDGCPSPASSGELALMRPPKSPASSGEIALLEAEEMLFGASEWSPASSGEMPLVESREFAPLPPTPERRRADYEEGSEGGSEGVVVEVAPGGGSMHRSTSPSLWNQLGSVSENLLLAARQKKGVASLPAADAPSAPVHPSNAPKAAHTRYARKAQHRHGLSLGDVPFADSPVGIDAPLPPSARLPDAVSAAGAPPSSFSADSIAVGSYLAGGSSRSGRSGGIGGKKSSKGRVAARASASATELDRWSVLPYGGGREKPRESRESTRVKQAPCGKEHGGVTSGAAAVPGDFLSSYFGDAPDAYVGEFALQEARNAARNAHKKTAAQTESVVSATPRKQSVADAVVRHVLAEKQAENERAQERRRDEQQQWADEQQRLQQQLQLLRQQQKLQLLQAFHETNQQHLRPCDFVLGRPYSSLLRRFVLAPQELGSGQFGVIRKCVERGTHRVLACKTILKSNIAAMQDAADIRHEVAVMEALKGHPHVVKIEDTCEDEEAVHIVMELCSGGDLFDRVKDEGRLKERTAAIACRQVVQALMWCHVSGVVHRDVKPENILLKGRREGGNGADEQNKGNMGAAAAVLGGIMAAPAKGAGGAGDEDEIHVKLADFGVATFTRGEPCTEELGTLQYMAPEVLAGTYGPAADIWSAGVVLHIMLSGRTPFFASLGRTVQEAILHGPVRMRGPHWEGVSEDAKSLVRAMLDKDAATRITAKEILGHPWITKHTQ